MEECQTQAAVAIDEYGMKAAYNLAAIKLLSDTTYLAFILKRTVKELKNFSEEEIASRICDLRPHKVPVDPGKTNNPAFQQDPNNYYVGEGHFIFDLLFSVRVAMDDGNSIRALIHVDLEIQRDYTPGYVLEQRAIFYTARELSTEFGDGKVLEYGGLEKCYSIWLCIEAPDYAANTISDYKIEKHDIFGTCDVPEYAYDLMEVVMIRVSKDFYKADRSNDLITMVAALLSNHLELDKRKEALESVGISMTEEAERRICGMCNIADSLWDEAHEAGKAEGMAEGKAEGMAEGKEEGKTEGMNEMLAATKAILDLVAAGVRNLTQLVTRSGYSEPLVLQIVDAFHIDLC